MLNSLRLQFDVLWEIGFKMKEKSVDLGLERENGERELPWDEEVGFGVRGLERERKKGSDRIENDSNETSWFYYGLLLVTP